MEKHMTRLGRRELLRKSAALSALIVACGGAPAVTASSPTASPRPSPTATPLPSPETTTIRLTAQACDAPVMAAERFLREEGFTDVQISDAAAVAALSGGKADLGPVFMTQLASAVEGGKPMVGVAGMHAGCAEVWAAQSIKTLADLRGRTVAVAGKTVDNVGYAFIMIALKNAGIDPASVTFAAATDPVKEYLEGRADAVFVATTGAVALRANPANKGHVILDQAMEKPWSEQDCCILVGNTDWLKANPIAAKRAVRAILRAADSLGPDRADAVKLATDKGLFGGAKSYDAVKAAANMVSLDWRVLDPARSLRFHAGLLAQVGLVKMPADEIATKGADLSILKSLK